MSSAGQQLVAGRIPGERIATTIETDDSGEFGTQTQVMSVTAPLVAGRVYRVTADLSVDSDTNGDRIVVRMKRDNATGGNMQIKNVHIEVSSGFGWPVHLEAEYTPSVNETKTFVVTIDGVSGSSLVHLEASSAGWPAFMYVDYIRG